MRNSIIAIGLALASVPGVQAQSEKRLDVTGFVGGLSVNHDLGSAQNVFLSTTGQGENVGFGKFFGARAGYHLWRDISVEGSFTRSEEDFTATVQDMTLGAFDAGQQFSADQTTITGNVVIDFNFDRPFVPFVTAGAGWSSAKPRNPIAGIDSIDTLDVNVGGGVKYFFMTWIGARVDARYHFLSDGFQYAGGGGSSPRHFELSVGGIVRLF